MLNQLRWGFSAVKRGHLNALRQTAVDHQGLQQRWANETRTLEALRPDLAKAQVLATQECQCGDKLNPTHYESTPAWRHWNRFWPSWHRLKPPQEGPARLIARE